MNKKRTSRPGDGSGLVFFFLVLSLILSSVSNSMAAAPPGAHVPETIDSSSGTLSPQADSATSAPRIRLAVGEFDPLVTGEPAGLPSALRVSDYAGDGSGYYLVQFDGPIAASDVDALTAAGAQVFDYIPDFTFIVKMDRVTRASVEEMAQVRWVGLYQPAYRLPADLLAYIADDILFSDRSWPSGERQFADPNLLWDDGAMEVIVSVFRGEALAPIITQIENEGGVVLRQSQTKWKSKLHVSISPSRFADLAAISGVRWIEEAPEWRLFNNEAADIMGVREVWDTHGLYGGGQTIAVCDTGLDQGSTSPSSLHDDFENGSGSSRILAVHDVAGDGAPSDVNSGHGTHVAGSVLGNGDLSGATPSTHNYPSTAYVGMAPEASLVFQASEDNDSEDLLTPADLNDLFAQAAGSGANLHTNSWGSSVPSIYTSNSQEVDEYVWDHKDFTILFAAGNEGIDNNADGVIDRYSVGAPATAKNCITVGATENDRPSGSTPTPGYDIPWGTGSWAVGFPSPPISTDHVSDNPQGMAAFSSRGPVLDGRHKPDIVAPGTNIASTRSSLISGDGWGPIDANYMFMGGTSMATPLAAGAATLVRQYYTDRESITPSAALIKATLVNGATNIAPGQYGTGATQEIPDARPNHVAGWGRVNLENSIFPASPRTMRYEDETTGLNTGQSDTYNYTVSSSSEPLHVTLAWSDYPGSPPAAGGLVNDLDLTITGPGGTYYPNNASQRGATNLLAYDDGTMSGFFRWTTGIRNAVRFTPTSYPATLQTGLFLVGSYSGDYPKTFNWYVYDGNDTTGPSTVLASGATTIRALGWHPVDLSGAGVTISSGDFFLAIELPDNDLVWFIDDSSPVDERSWDYDSGSWSKWTDYDYMFNAIVTSADAATDQDRVNNLVGIDIESPPTGEYVVTVSGYNVPFGPQPYALVTSGAIDGGTGNTAPSIPNLPDLSLPVNTSLDNAIDLWAYATDAESTDAELTFSIDNTPDLNAGVSIDGNRYIDINPTVGWTGQTDIVIRVTDPGGLSDTDTFRVTVTPSADKTWDGSVSSDWHTADNWTPAGVPTSSDDVLIPDVTNDPVISAGDAEADNLTIDVGAVVDLTERALTVEGILTNNGTLKQTQDVGPGSGTEFLRITNLAGNQTKYYGVDITPSSALDVISGPAATGDGIDANGDAIASTPNVDVQRAIVDPKTFPEATTTILMDYSHGVLFDNDPTTDYTNLTALLEAQGHTVVASNQGILNLTLDDYGVIVLNSMWSATSPYSTDEVSALQNFVDTGGGLLLIGEATACGGCPAANSNLNQVATALAGITLGDSTISPTDLYFSNFQPHDIFSGVSQLYYRYAGALDIVPPSVELAYTDSSSDVTVAGYGKIIAVGDSFMSDGSYWGIADDVLFLENIFDWLSRTAMTNTLPTLSDLPDQTVPMNGSADNAIDLWTYADDAEDDDADLTFTVTNSPDPNAGVSIDSNRYIDIYPVAGWAGQTDVEVQVQDTGGLTDTETFQVTVSSDPDIEVSPTLFDELVRVDGMLTQTLTISNTGGDSLIFLVDDGGAAWLSQNPGSGTVAVGGAQLVDVVFDATGLSMGDYTADLTIVNNDPDENPVTVPVTMHVTDNMPPTISGIPDQVVIPGSAYIPLDLWPYASDPESPADVLTYTIDNVPDPDAGVSIDSNRYVDIIPTPGWTGQTTVVVRVTDPGGLFDTDPFSVTVGQFPDIEVVPTAFDETVPQGEVLTRTLTISNTGADDLIYVIDDGGASWLSQDPTAGIVSAGGSLPVDVVFDATGLTSGDHSATLTVSSNDPDEDTVTVPVVMHVEVVGEFPDIEVVPNTFDETVPRDGTLTRTLTISNTGTDYLIFVINDGGASWLSEEPASGMVLAGGARAVDTVFDATGMTAGDYTTNLAISSNDPDEGVVTVTVTMHVTVTGDLTSVTVSVSGNQFCSGRTTGVKRCFDIDPAGPMNATVRFYLSEGERNGQTLDDLLVFHYDGDWVEEPGPYIRGGTGDAQFVEAQNVDGFSPFALDRSIPMDAYLPLVMKRWPPIPDSPVLNAISNADGDGDYTVSWNTAFLANTYTLQEDDNPSFSSPTTVYGPGSSTSTYITGRSYGTYYYRVKATNAYGDSGWSNVQSVNVMPPTTIYASSDTTILQGYPTNNFCDTTDMWAGYDDYLDPDGKIVRSLIQFDVSSIPAGTPISEVTLNVRLHGYYDFPNRSRTITTYRVGSTWSACSTTWNNQPSIAEAYGSRSVAQDLGSWYAFDVTNLVRGWVNGSFVNDGLWLRGPEASGSDSSWRSFYTRDSASDPYLSITYSGFSGTEQRVVLDGEADALAPTSRVIEKLDTSFPANTCQSSSVSDGKCVNVLP